MTDFDIKLIRKSDMISKWDYQHIDVLIKIADTTEAKEHLARIRQQLRDMAHDSL